MRLYRRQSVSIEAAEGVSCQRAARRTSDNRECLVKGSVAATYAQLVDGCVSPECAMAPPCLAHS